MVRVSCRVECACFWKIPSSDVVMIPLTAPIVRKSDPEVKLELSDISHIHDMKEPEWILDKGPDEFNDFIEEKLQNLDLESADAALELFYANKGKIELKELHRIEYANGDLDEPTCPEKFSDYHLNDFHKKIQESCSLFKKSSKNVFEPSDDYLHEREGMIFDAPLKPIHLQPRKSIFPRKPSRLHRIPFRSRLETVLEQSPGFSYLFPED